MKDNKTWTPVVITVFLRIHLHEQSSLPNLLNLQNQPIEIIQSSHHIHKAHSTMGIINPQSIKISNPFQSHHINPITRLVVQGNYTLLPYTIF